jgi:two-component SAPR family response regulator
MLRAMIVDDEELSVQRLGILLSESGELGLCAAFLNPAEAYEFAKTNPVDVAFLDISMPDIDGMLLSTLLHDLDDSIDIVFVTGYDEYAVQAFDRNALDYLLKPVTAERLSRTLDKIRKRHRSAAADGSSAQVLLFNGLKLYRRERDQVQVKLRSPKTEELFAFLVCKGTVSREEIVDTLWSGLEKNKALKNLNSTLYYIRKAFDNGESDSFLAAGKHEIGIREGALRCDLYEFERLLKQVRQAPEKQAELFRRAETLYTGRLLQGKDYEWAAELARSLERQYIELLEAGARFHIGINKPQQALHYFSEILKLDAMREDIHHEAIRLYVELGRKNEAFRQYRVMEEMLEKELGAKPDPRMKHFITKMGP